MTLSVWGAFGWVFFWVLGLLFSEARNSTPGLWITKPMASIGLLVLGFLLSDSPFGSAQSIFVFTAIFFCIVGDVLLIPLNEKIFMAGIGCFAIGHIGYLSAFVMRGLNQEGRSLIFAVPVVAFVSVLVTRYLWNKIPGALRLAVVIYVFLISGIVLAGWYLSSSSKGELLLLGTSAFYVSDISVALDRFVQRKFLYRLWGLPLYYLAQTLIIFGMLTT